MAVDDRRSCADDFLVGQAVFEIARVFVTDGRQHGLGLVVRHWRCGSPGCAMPGRPAAAWPTPHRQRRAVRARRIEPRRESAGEHRYGELRRRRSGRDRGWRRADDDRGLHHWLLPARPACRASCSFGLTKSAFSRRRQAAEDAVELAADLGWLIGPAATSTRPSRTSMSRRQASMSALVTRRRWSDRCPRAANRRVAEDQPRNSHCASVSASCRPAGSLMARLRASPPAWPPAAPARPSTRASICAAAVNFARGADSDPCAKFALAQLPWRPAGRAGPRAWRCGPGPSDPPSSAPWPSPGSASLPGTETRCRPARRS